MISDLPGPADLDKLITALDLRDLDPAGHSMGGGEIARYLGTYGSDRVRRAAIIAGIPPYLLKTADTPQGVPQEPFDQIAGALTADRFAYFTEWNKAFFNLDQTLGTPDQRGGRPGARWHTASTSSPGAVRGSPVSPPALRPVRDWRWCRLRPCWTCPRRPARPFP